jgi:alpha-amylase/alpha-mannosidase (GH57 family)
MENKIYISFLWHQHQPYYKNPISEKYILPWVRLHAVKDYFDMVAILDNYPKIKQTFNLVPSLLMQIEDYVKNSQTDIFFDLTVKSVDNLDNKEKIFILKNFFMANADTMIDVFPRYRELFDKRGRFVTDAQLENIAQTFSSNDFLDLQVWFNLCWIDPYFRHRDSFIEHLLEKGRMFTEEEKNILMQKHIEIMSKIIPKHKELQERGQIEISTTPFYHPILPLLADSYNAKASSNDITLPEFRFSHIEDAAMQVKRGMDYYEKLFGVKPRGMWPSEGSVSDEVIKIAGDAGFKWVASDEDILFHSLDTKREYESLYKPYKAKIKDREVSMVFRNKRLSDLIGFSYARMDAKAAVEDFFNNLYDIKKNLPHSNTPYLINVILDGENCWEYYKNDGHDFLNILYAYLSDSQDFETITISDFLEKFPPENELRRIFPGSWIYHSFDIWIGHEEDNRAWDSISKARKALVEYSIDHEDIENINKAWEHIYIAEGSDWFWWYGDDHMSQNDLEFDSLFRTHLIKVYKLIGKEVPQELYKTIKRVYEKKDVVDPIGLIEPIIDGKISSYFEWYNAGYYNVGNIGSTMHHVSNVIKSFHYGFDLNNLFVRIDVDYENYPEIGNICLNIVFLDPKDYEVIIHYDKVLNNCYAEFYKKTSDQRKMEVIEIAKINRVEAGDIIECEIPLELFAKFVDKKIEFVVTVTKDNIEMERWPYQNKVSFELPNSATFFYNW